MAVETSAGAGMFLRENAPNAPAIGARFRRSRRAATRAHSGGPRGDLPKGLEMLGLGGWAKRPRRPARWSSRPAATDRTRASAIPRARHGRPAADPLRA